MKCFISRLVLVLVLLFSNSVVSQIPNYYSSVNFDLSGDALKTELSELIINTHTTYIPYTSSSTDTWDILRMSDLEDTDSDQVLLIYGYDNNDGVFKTDRTRYYYDTCHSGSCAGLWNREHVFAKSLANPNLEVNYPGPGTDVHNLRPADSQMNSSRSNRFFAEGSGTSEIIDGDFYPGDEWKGDVARIIMYMYLRYPSQCRPTDIGAGSRSYSPEYDMPNIFLEWNQQDPVSDLELTRNNTISSYQGNRNPFIDNPYLATLIWNGPQAEDRWGVLTVATSELSNVKLSSSVTQTTVDVIGLNNSSFLYTIYNQLGQQMDKNYSNKTIDVSKLNTGLYILRINVNSSLFQFKILKE